MACDVSLGEARAGVRVQVLPLAFERVELGRVLERGEVLEQRLGRQVRLQPAAPFAERAGIVCYVRPCIRIEFCIDFFSLFV